MTKYTWVMGDHLVVVENEILKSAYHQLDGNIEKMCALMGVSRSTMYRKLERAFGPVEFIRIRHERFKKRLL